MKRFVRALRLVVTSLATILTLASLAAPAHADDCGGRSLSSIHGGSYDWVELRWQADHWELRTTPAPGQVGAWMPVPEPEGKATHAHLMVFAPKTHTWFAVIDTSAEHAAERRVRVYDAAGKMVAAYGLGDFMTPAELAQVTRSISHIHWLGEGAREPKLEDDGNTLPIVLVGGRTVRLGLGGPAITLR